MLAALAWVLVAAVTAVAFWGRNRGLDLTDEGYYLLGLRPAQARVEVVSDWAQVMVTLAGRRELGLGAWRLVSAAVILASTLMFGAAVARFVRARGLAGPLTARGTLLPAMCALGGLFMYGFFPPTPSYNTCTLVAVYATAALVLWTVADPRAPSRAGPGTLAAAVGIGALLVFQFFAKPPAAVALVIATGAFALVVRRPRSWAGVAVWLGAAAAGAAIALAAYFAFVRAPGEYLAQLREQLRVIAATSHGSGALVAGYVSDSRRLVGLAVRLAPWYLTVGALGWVATRKTAGRSTPRLVTGALLVCLVLAALWLVHQARSRGLLDPSVRVFERTPLYLCWLLTIPALWLGVYVARRADATRSSRVERDAASWMPDVALFGFLIALPLVAAAGTNNPLYGQAAFHGAAWFAACLLLLERVAGVATLRAVAYGGAAAMLIGTGAELMRGFVVQPYRLGAPRYQQTALLRDVDPAVGRVYVDPVTAPLVDSVARALRGSGFRPRDAILGLYDVPGLVYLLGGTSPGGLWFSSRPEEQGRNCYLLREANLAPGRPLYMVVNFAVPAEMLACLQRVGIGRPDDAQPLVTLPLRNTRTPERSEMLRVYRFRVTGAPGRSITSDTRPNRSPS
ncbi:MAG TPA: hypothetical protein VGD56_02660 [Gemmatirosa sp.]